MQTIVRLTLLGVCASVGIAIAISLAAQTNLSASGSSTTGTIHSSSTEVSNAAPIPHADSIDTQIVPAPPKNLLSVEARPEPHDAPSIAASAASESLVKPVQELPPTAPIARQPLDDHLQRLEKAIARAEQATTQSQFDRLEAQIARMAQENNRLREDILVREQGTVAAQVSAEAEPVPAIAAPVLARGSLQIGEGDVGLNLNMRDQDLRELLDFLSTESDFSILASKSVTGEISATFNGVSAEQVLAAVLQMTGYVARREGNIVYVGTPQEIRQMEQMREVVETRIYRTNYVTAAELQKLITPLLTESLGVVTVSTRALVDIPASNVTTGGDDFAGNEVLLVRDYESVLKRIDALVAKVDQRPRQVVIEAMILSVNLDDAHEFGVNFEVFKNDASVRLVSGSPLASLGQIDISGGGLNFGVLNGDVGAFVKALESIGDTNVIAAPRLLCLNKQRAEILIGDQKGFISTTQTETSTTQSVEFLDIGTQLRIRPYISDDGMIRLEVHPELSTGDVKLLGGFALPEKSVTQVTTNIMCRDGATVVIGGLIREDYSRSISQVVGVGNLPIVGALFRNKTDSVSRNEIVVLITPRIIHDPAANEDAPPHMGDIFGRQAAVDSTQVHRISPIARHCYGDRYYRLAQTAWVAGNAPEALRYLEIALQFQPRHRQARNLYGTISAGAAEHQLFDAETIARPIPLEDADMRWPTPAPLPQATNDLDPPLPPCGYEPRTEFSYSDE